MAENQRICMCVCAHCAHCVCCMAIVPFVCAVCIVYVVWAYVMCERARVCAAHVCVCVCVCVCVRFSSASEVRYVGSQYLIQ